MVLQIVELNLLDCSLHCRLFDGVVRCYKRLQYRRKRRGKIEPGWNFRQPEMTGRFLKTKVLNHLIPSPDHMWKPPGGIKGADRGLGKGWKLEGATNRT